MYQSNLFEITKTPNKITVVEDFLNQAEESALLKHFESIVWQKVQMHGVIAKRRVAHFGLDYTYTKRAVNKTQPAPKWLNDLMARAAKLINKSPLDLKETLITFYPQGAGIGWHKDAEVFGDAVVGISLLSDCTMKFKNPSTKEVIKLFIPRRSAYVFSDEARWKWLHSISSHLLDRYSITFRTLNAPAGRDDQKLAR
jgi:alkylated DNA repair protein (DNA oxidative demethylase)